MDVATSCWRDGACWSGGGEGALLVGWGNQATCRQHTSPGQTLVAL